MIMASKELIVILKAKIVNGYMAKYSSKQRAIKAMKILHEAYTGMPVIFQNVHLDDSVKKMKKRGVENGSTLPI